MLASIRFSGAFGHDFLLARLGRSSWRTAGHPVAQQSAFPEFLRASTVGPAKLRLPSSHRRTWPFASTSPWKGAASKTQGNRVTVHGEHEHNSDDHGCFVKLRLKCFLKTTIRKLSSSTPDPTDTWRSWLREEMLLRNWPPQSKLQACKLLRPKVLVKWTLPATCVRVSLCKTSWFCL